MPRLYPMRASSALIRFFLPPNTNGEGVHLFVNGTPDKVRLALRRACSHRRTMVLAKPGYYFINVIGQCAKIVPQDCAAFWFDGTAEHDTPIERISWLYEISVVNGQAIIKWGEQGHSPTVEPLFQFFGYEWRRPKTPRKPREGKAKGGRPSGFRKKFGHLLTQGKNGDALDLKQSPAKSRKIKVDFTGVESVDRTRGERISTFEERIIDDALSPAERAEGPGA